MWVMSKRPRKGTGNIDSLISKGKGLSLSFLPDSNKLSITVKTMKTMKNNGLDEDLEGINSTKVGLRQGIWNYIVLSIKNRELELYINGKLSEKVALSTKPKLSYSKLSIGGFDGLIRNVQMSNYVDKNLQTRSVHPDAKLNKIIRGMWKQAGCLNNPIPPNNPNKYANWKKLLKDGKHDEVKAEIQNIKAKADQGDQKMQNICYGKFTASMINKLAEKEKLIQYTLDQQAKSAISGDGICGLDDKDKYVRCWSCQI
jgi:hypothetical protein